MGDAVKVVRLYLTEGDHRLNSLLTRLHDTEKVRGVTVFRGISGFGPSGKVHDASLIDLAMDLPLVVEFFDTPQRADEIVAHIKEMFEPGHILSWMAEQNDV